MKKRPKVVFWCTFLPFLDSGDRIIRSIMHMILLDFSFGPSNVTGKSCRLNFLDYGDSPYQSFSAFLLEHSFYWFRSFDWTKVCWQKQIGVDFGQGSLHSEWIMQRFSNNVVRCWKTVAGSHQPENQVIKNSSAKPMLLGWSSSAT